MEYDDVYFMQLALVEAKRGIYTTAPNPNVGCVIVKNKQVIATGFHHYCGGVHAEIDALSKVDIRNVAGADIYVTLEPCCHLGKTPPCVDALISAKPRRVIVACLDPFPLVAGNGIAKLRGAKIETVVGICEHDALEINRGFMKRIKYGKPWVTLKIASSLDGKIALTNGQSKWITSHDARQDSHYLRASSCAIITGSGTIIHDNPSMTVRDIGIVKNPWRIVIDNRLQTALTSKIYQRDSHDGDSLRRILATASNNITINDFMDAGVEVWNDITSTISNRVDLALLLKKLGDASCNYVMIESGSALSGAFLFNNLVDEIVLYIAPSLIGNVAQSMFMLPEISDLSHKDSWAFDSVTQVGSDIKIIARKKLLVT